MKDSLREIMIRLYDSRVIARLDDLWDKFSKYHTTKNSFIVDLLTRGIENVENEEADIKEMRSSGNIFKELKRISNLLDRMIDVGADHYQESFVSGKENQILLSRLYHVIFKLAKDKGVSIDSYNKGFFDELPENFEQVTRELIEEFKTHNDNT